MAYFTYILSGTYFSGFFAATETSKHFGLAQISHTSRFGFAARSPAAKIHGAATAAGSAFAVRGNSAGWVCLGEENPGSADGSKVYGSVGFLAYNLHIYIYPIYK